MNKLNALFIGNCHCSGLVYYLNKCLEFKNTFNVKQYANWQMIANKESVPVKDIQTADLFIFQPLPEVHGCYSTDPTVENSIGSFVKKNCIKISFPYTYSSALWPLCQPGQNQNRWFGWNCIHKLKEQGLNQKDIINLYKTNQIDWEYSIRFEQSINILKEKESKTDIKISNFIIDNFNNKLLFLIPQHPTSIVFIHLTNQILKKLNMNLIDINEYTDINEVGLPDSTYNLKSNRFPLHISAISHYNMNYTPDENADSFYESRINDYFYYNPGMQIPNYKHYDDR
jgi:hypothetical protein